MKNIFLIPTPKESRLWRDLDSNKLRFENISKPNSNECTKCSNEYVYITSDSKFVRDEYITDGIEVIKATPKLVDAQGLVDRRDWKKIVMTNDLELIEDGVQQIGDLFFRWFVLNPTYEEVEVVYGLFNPIGRQVDPNDLGQNHSQCVWKYKIITTKEESKKVLTEEDIFNQRDIDAVTDYINKEQQKQHLIDIMESDEELGLYEQIDQNNLVTKGSTSLVKEIKLEDVFNDKKREGAKKVIHQHKVLKGLYLINPAHLEMTSNGHGEFPDGYKLTEKGIQYIIEQLNKE
jgi:hypothetical protein